MISDCLAGWKACAICCCVCCVAGDDHDDWPKKGVREKLAQRLAGNFGRNSDIDDIADNESATSSRGSLQLTAAAASGELMQQQQHAHTQTGLPPLPPNAH